MVTPEVLYAVAPGLSWVSEYVARDYSQSAGPDSSRRAGKVGVAADASGVDRSSGRQKRSNGRFHSTRRAPPPSTDRLSAYSGDRDRSVRAIVITRSGDRDR